MIAISAVSPRDDARAPWVRRAGLAAERFREHRVEFVVPADLCLGGHDPAPHDGCREHVKEPLAISCSRSAAVCPAAIASMSRLARSITRLISGCQTNFRYHLTGSERVSASFGPS
jgi:hypothetical protein